MRCEGSHGDFFFSRKLFIDSIGTCLFPFPVSLLLAWNMDVMNRALAALLNHETMLGTEVQR